MHAHLIGRFLEGAWRAAPPPLLATAQEVADVTPLLTGSGAASLGWWRVSAMSELSESSQVVRLHGAARMQAIGDGFNQRAMAEIAGILRAAGVVPLVFKGWAAGRYYAQSWLRPYGDFDLLVHPREFARACEALSRHSDPKRSSPEFGDYLIRCDPRTRLHRVDLHSILPAQYEMSVDALFERARPVLLGKNLSILVPSLEDHLRIVCVHYWRHGAWRPLWLCDIAAMLEAADAQFNWERCLTSKAATRMWIGVAIGAAKELLNCRVDHVPADRWAPVPEWIKLAILREWSAPFAHRAIAPRIALTSTYVAGKIRSLWPNPIQAAFLNWQTPYGRRRHRDRIRCFVTDVGKSGLNALRTAWWQRIPARMRGN